MGILATLVDKLRTTVADAASSALGAPSPLELQCISGAGSADLVYQGFRGNLRVLVLRDYPEAPWAWIVEDSTDGRMLAFRGSVASYDAAVVAVSEWLAGYSGVKHEVLTEPPSAA